MPICWNISLKQRLLKNGHFGNTKWTHQQVYLHKKNAKLKTQQLTMHYFLRLFSHVSTSCRLLIEIGLRLTSQTKRTQCQYRKVEVIISLIGTFWIQRVSPLVREAYELTISSVRCLSLLFILMNGNCTRWPVGCCPESVRLFLLLFCHLEIFIKFLTRRLLLTRMLINVCYLITRQF